jgi:Arc/MetJ-type ribon-helix-helix transcriptional regulator
MSEPEKEKDDNSETMLRRHVSMPEAIWDDLGRLAEEKGHASKAQVVREAILKYSDGGDATGGSIEADRIISEIEEAKQSARRAAERTEEMEAEIKELKSLSSGGSSAQIELVSDRIQEELLEEDEPVTAEELADRIEGARLTQIKMALEKLADEDHVVNRVEDSETDRVFWEIV